MLKKLNELSKIKGKSVSSMTTLIVPPNYYI